MAYSQSLRERRHFWRRVLAYLIDGFVLNLVLLVPVMLLSSQFFNGSFMPNLDPKLCISQPSRPEVAAQLQAAPEEEEAVSLECPMHDLLHGDRTLIIAMVAPKPGAAIDIPKFGFFIRDATGIHRQNLLFAILMPQLLMGFGLPAMFAVFSAGGRQPLGKKLMGLQVVRTDGSFPGMIQALNREYWKFLPILLMEIGLAGTILASGGDWPFSVIRSAAAGDFSELIKMVGIVFGGEVLWLIWWLGPFIVWTGQTWYDGLAGTKIVRK